MWVSRRCARCVEPPCCIIVEERYDYAKKLKLTISELQKVGEKLGKYEAEKRQAVENEDYDKAKLKKIQMDEYRLQVYQELEIQDLLEAAGVSTGCKCTRSWRYRTYWRPQGWVQAVSVPGAGDAGPTGDHRGEYRLQVYQELDKQDLLETTEVSTGYMCTRSWTYKTYWRPQRWVQTVSVPGAGDAGPIGDHRGEYRL